MYEISFVRRLRKLGLRGVILSPDTLLGIIAFFSIYILTDGGIPYESAQEIIPIMASVSASLFAIVLTGLAIITSFTDKAFVYAWKQIDEFDNMITVFQYNLYIPIIVLSLSIFVGFVYYSELAMIILSSIFVYMVTSLIDLVNFICRYGLQRGEFVRQEIETENTGQGLSQQDLAIILNELKKIEDQ